MHQHVLPHYATINDFLVAAGFAERTWDPNLYAVRLEDTYPYVRAVMPPFRKDFYLEHPPCNTHSPLQGR